MDESSMREMYRMTQENNRMLHSMRRNAFWGGLLKFVIYAAFLLAPIWFYYTYLDSTVQAMLKTMQEVQGTSAKAQGQFGDFSAMLKQFQEKFQSQSQ